MYLTLVIAYFLGVVLPHEWVGKWLAVTLDEPLGRNRYNQIVLAAASMALAAFLYIFWRNIRAELKANRGALTYLAVTLAAVALAFKLLVVVNIEAIHLLQYALLAILLVPAVGSYGLTLCWATFLGAVDEAWQHFYLAPLKSDYYDFNDILLDLLGAALGLVLMKSSIGGAVALERKKAALSLLLIISSAIALLLVVAFTSGLLHYHAQTGDQPLRWALVRVPHHSFWKTVHPNVTFHVIQPMEGLMIIAFLMLYYQGLDEAVNTARK
jgi:hypothetical protein